MIYLIYVIYIIVPIFILPVSGYFHKTHEFLGNYLEQYIQTYYPKFYLKSKQLIHNESFSEASTWADKIKSRNEYTWSKPFHYIDVKMIGCNKSNFELDHYCNNNCIYSAILNMTNSLTYNDKLDDKWKPSKNNIYQYENFKFLIHFLQDLNQPMHLLGFYRGGNDYHIDLQINGHIRKTNLHTLWDSIIPEYYISKFNYTYKSFSIKHINTIYEYEDLLKSILKNNFDTICHQPISKTIIFEEYFNKTIIEYLFDNYMNISINTLNFIYKEPNMASGNTPSKIVEHN